jgi:hypothetical protein
MQKAKIRKKQGILYETSKTADKKQGEKRKRSGKGEKGEKIEKRT